MSHPTENDQKNQSPDPALSDYSPKDAQWDDVRASTERVSQMLYRAGEFESWAHRMHDCTGLLRFAELADTSTGEISLKLRYAGVLPRQTLSYVPDEEIYRVPYKVPRIPASDALRAS